MSRPALARIDLEALRHNYRLARRLHGGRALAVIKANAYGHGALRCAQALADEADGYAVAFLEEAIPLREAGITQPILLLEGLFEAYELSLAMRHDLWIVVHNEVQLRMIETAAPPGARLTVWLKMNSGMNRAGFNPGAYASAYHRLLASGKVVRVVHMSHLARADEPEVEATRHQTDTFHRTLQDLPGERSLCNSAGVLGWPASHQDWARPGIMLYGADPLPGAEHGLKPVMSLQSAIMAVREIKAGDELGYGARYTAAQPTRVGLVAMGYADGYPRVAGNGTPVAVGGQSSQLIGRVSMDMLTVDLSHLPQAGVGTPVELWGRHVPVNAIADAAGTIAYELLCNVKRVRLEYHDNPEPPGKTRPQAATPNDAETRAQTARRATEPCVIA